MNAVRPLVAARPSGSLRAMLERHDIVPTSQRLVIAGVLFERDQHLTAEQVLAELRAKGQRVSKATVYNTLNLFAAKGLIRPLNLDPTRCSFDSNMTPHFHLFEVDSGEILDIAPEDIQFTRLPRLPADMELLGMEVVLRVRHKS